MIDYYETKSQPITRLSRIRREEAYWKVRKNKGGMGIDGMSWKELDKFVEPKFHKSSYGYRKGRSQYQGGSEANDHLRNKSEINKQCIGKVQVDEYP